jgi:hypothetical protein
VTDRRIEWGHDLTKSTFAVDVREDRRVYLVLGYHFISGRRWWRERLNAQQRANLVELAEGEDAGAALAQVLLESAQFRPPGAPSPGAAPYTTQQLHEIVTSYIRYGVPYLRWKATVAHRRNPGNIPAWVKAGASGPPLLPARPNERKVTESDQAESLPPHAPPMNPPRAPDHPPQGEQLTLGEL